MSTDSYSRSPKASSAPTSTWRGRPARSGEPGALEFRECVTHDVKMGEITCFPRSVQIEDGETVVFS
jgi:uncharacterized protein YbaA (DUF1428 family)